MAEKTVFLFPGPYGPEKSGFSAYHSLKSELCQKLYHFWMILAQKREKQGQTGPETGKNGCL